MQVRPRQISAEGAIPGQLLGLVGTEWAPVNPPSGGGGGGGGGTGAFFDDFERPDTPLDGNNGWAAATAMAAANGDQVATFGIVGGVLTGSDTWGGYPILHDRQSSVAGVADVACDVGFPDAASEGNSMGIVFAAKPDCSEALGFLFDGSVGYWEVDRWADGRYSGSPSVVTDHGWVAWHYTDPMTIRCVYTEATYTLEVYQNGTLALTIDISDTNGGFYFGHEVAALSTMTHAGLLAAYSAAHNIFNNFSVDGATSAGGGGGGGTGTVAVLDDLTDVDTTTTAPADGDTLRFDLASGLWLPVAPSVPTPVGAIVITDTPDDPPPYDGYAYLTSDGKLRIWTGTEWRQILSTVYVPPAVGDAAITLPSLVGWYRADELAYADAAAVAAWPDKSDLNNDLVVTTAGAMQTAGIGGLKSVLFDTTTLYQLPAAMTTPLTVIAVLKNTDTSEGSILFSSGDNTAYAGLVLGGGWRVSDGSTTYVDHAAGATTLDPHVFYGRVGAASTTAGIDGAKTSIGAAIGLHALRLGNWAPAAQYSMTGLVSEMIVYDTDLTDAELDAITHHLGEMYGITTSV